MKRTLGDFLLWFAFRQPRYYTSPLARSIAREYIIPLGSRARSDSPLAITLDCSCTFASGEHTCGLVRHG